MGKIGAYQPVERYKNYSLPTAKPLRSQAFYTEKVWTLQDRIYGKLKRVAKFLENLHSKLKDDFNKNIKVTIEKNLEILTKDLDLLQRDLNENQDAFNTNKLKTDQRCITEMKSVCDNLQAFRSYEYEFKEVGKIKHALSELEHLIQPTSFERSLEKARIKSEPKRVSAKKEHALIETSKKVKGKPTVKPKKRKTISQKAKSTTKLPKPIKAHSIQPQKSKATLHKLKQSEKKVAKSKLPAKSALKSKPKPNSSSEHKKKISR